MKQLNQTVIIVIVALLNICAITVWVYLSVSIENLGLETDNLRAEITESESIRDGGISQKR